MKILQVINEVKLGGGAEKLMVDLSVGLKHRGIDVAVLSIVKPKYNDLVTKLNQEGIVVYAVSQNLYSIRNIFKVREFLKKRTFDIVHVHLFPSLYYIGLSKLLGVNKCLIFTEHSTKNRRRHKILFKYLDRIIYKQYNSVVSISNQVYENLCLHLGVLRKNIIENAVDFKKYSEAEVFPIKEYLRIANTCYIVMMVARFVEGKDYLTLFKSLKYLTTDVHIVCIGDGPKIEYCKEYVKSLGESTRIHFLGLRNDVEVLLKSADVVVLSSGHEGFSISMLEAMASGKPFVASSVPGLIDVLGESALFFQYKNYKQLAQTIQMLKNDRVLYNRYSENSLKFAEAHDLSNMVNSYLKLYKANQQ